MAFQRVSVHRPISTPRERSGGKEKNEQLCSLRSQLRRNLRSAAEFAAAVSATAESKLNVRGTAQNFGEIQGERHKMQKSPPL